jgi:hypothetical protein
MSIIRTSSIVQSRPPFTTNQTIKKTPLSSSENSPNDDHLLALSQKIRSFFLSSKAPNDLENISEVLKSLNQNFPRKVTSLLKAPKWHDDAAIFRVFDTKNPTDSLAIKIHENKYPMCSHFYNSPDLLKKLSSTGHIAKIFDSFILQDKNKHKDFNVRKEYRVTLYKFSNGTPLPALLRSANNEQIKGYQKNISDCMKNLLHIGVNPIIKDLDDLILEFKDGKENILISDVNCLMPCEKSDKYSKKYVMDIIDNVIKKLVTKNYIPYILERPTLADLRNK